MTVGLDLLAILSGCIVGICFMPVAWRLGKGLADVYRRVYTP